MDFLTLKERIQGDVGGGQVGEHLLDGVVGGELGGREAGRRDLLTRVPMGAGGKRWEFPRLYRVQLAGLQARNRGVAHCWLLGLGASALGDPPGATLCVDTPLSAEEGHEQILRRGRPRGEGRAQVLVQCWARRGSLVLIPVLAFSTLLVTFFSAVSSSGT